MNIERIYDENSRLTFEDIMLSMIEVRVKFAWG